MKEALTILMLVLLIGPLLIGVRRMRRLPGAISREANQPAGPEDAAGQGIPGPSRFDPDRKDLGKRD